jgi:hypothetical protein
MQGQQKEARNRESATGLKKVRTGIKHSIQNSRMFSGNSTSKENMVSHTYQVVCLPDSVHLQKASVGAS